jgi:hypothetical protein
MPICANDAPPISTTITNANKIKRIAAGMRIGFPPDHRSQNIACLRLPRRRRWARSNDETDSRNT